jgi:hypothetical protein
MSKKTKIVFIKRLFFNVMVLIFVIALGVKFKDFNFSLETKEDVHEWRKEGKCLECHSSHYYIDQDTKKECLNIPAAKYHTEEFRRFAHGRLEGATATRCYSCHEKSSCGDCHSKMPTSHTSDFIKPLGNTTGMQRHIMLGRLRPSSCLVCHKSFKSTCIQCHTMEEAEKWEINADEVLSKWTDLHKNFCKDE